MAWVAAGIARVAPLRAVADAAIEVGRRLSNGVGGHRSGEQDRHVRRHDKCKLARSRQNPGPVFSSFDCSSDMGSSFVSQGLLTQLPSRVEGGPNPLNRRVPFLTTVATPSPAGVDAVATFDVVRLRRPNITE